MGHAVNVLFATAELAPLVSVGGLAAAASGLVDALRRSGVDVTVVLPDYSGVELEDERDVEIDVPAWVGEVQVRRGVVAGLGELTLVDVPGIARPNPYVDADGNGWWDNDRRFFAFSAVVASLARAEHPDVVHLNDWHTATALAHLDPSMPVAFTIHTLGYQGQSDPGWLGVFPRNPQSFFFGGACNPVAGAIRTADVVIAVSPTYADEIVEPAGGFGLDGLLRERGDRLVGIRNGIDTTVWDPSADPFLAAGFGLGRMEAKAAARSAVLAEMGLPDDPTVPLLAVVTRLVDQKGVDLLLGTLPYLSTMPARLAVLGSGDRWLADALTAAASANPDWVAFRNGFDNALSHRLIAGADLFVMPSRFEPCGLAQMQAMRYGTIPVVTDVGGLHDTVEDIDLDRSAGTGVRAHAATVEALVDALHRGVRAWSNRARRDAMRKRGMSADWSWDRPAAEHIAWYERIVNEHGGST